MKNRTSILVKVLRTRTQSYPGFQRPEANHTRPETNRIGE
jgi:hypothetical protein